MMDIVMFESFKIFKMAVIVMEIQFSRRTLAQLVEVYQRGSDDILACKRWFGKVL